MKKIGFKDILLVDLGLINRCNLQCPLCPYVTKEISKLNKQEVDFDLLIKFLDKLENLEVAIIEGNYCEPTLYSRIYDLIEYFASRNVKMRLSTNGNTHNDAFWKKLGPLFNNDDIVRFAIDGSTQDMHSKYRVNGSIQKVLNHHTKLKETSFNGSTVLQNIVFDYNVNDKDNILKIFDQENFDYVSFIKCYNTDANKIINTEFRPVPSIDKFNKIYDRISKSLDNIQVSCDAYNRREIYINHKGNVILCGSLDEAQEYDNVPFITDDEDTIFDYIQHITNNINNCSTCKGDCNKFCYTLGEKFPDITINKDGEIREVNYFTKELYNEEGNILHQMI